MYSTYYLDFDHLPPLDGGSWPQTVTASSCKSNEGTPGWARGKLDLSKKIEKQNKCSRSE
jgi:hypothetical protein